MIEILSYFANLSDVDERKEIKKGEYTTNIKNTVKSLYFASLNEKRKYQPYKSKLILIFNNYLDMAEFEQKPSTGAIFKNEKKEKDTHPDYRGSITTPEGKKYDLSLWIKDGAKGKYFSVSVQEPFKKEQIQQAVNTQSNDLPF